MIILLVFGIVLVLAEITRGWIAGELITLRRPRRRIVVEGHVAALVLCLMLFFVSPIVFEMIVGQQPREAASGRSVLVSIIVDFVIVGLTVPLLIISRQNRLADFGLDLRNWRGEVRFGGLGFLMSFPLVLIALVLMASIRGPETEHPYLKLLERTDSERAIIGIAVAAVIAAPLTEELIFRVLFQGLLESLVPPSVAILIPAVCFCAIHGRYDAIPLFPLALALGLVYHIRRSYIAVVTIHALFNATFMILTLLPRGLFGGD